MHYDVASELNPKYMQTQNMHDYFGIYHVIEVDDNDKAKILETFDNGLDDDRRQKAYKRARELNHLKRFHDETGL